MGYQTIDQRTSQGRREATVVFWEKCFRRTYHAFTTLNRAGFAYIIWWLKAAEGRGLLHFDDFNSASLCGVMRAVGVKDPIGQRAFEALLWRTHGDGILAFERGDFSTAVTGLVMDRHDPRSYGMGLQAIRQLYSQRLTRFLSRYYWAEERWAKTIADEEIKAAYEGWHPLLNSTFEEDLLRRVLRRIDDAEKLAPDELPRESPAWHADLPSDKSMQPGERTFLRESFVFDSQTRMILFLTVYAGWLPRDLVNVIFEGQQKLPTDVMKTLHSAWKRLFNNL